jgi:hypothetical protein
MARQQGLKAIALVDHDTLLGHGEFVQEARRQGIEAVPGVEISTSVNGLRIHVLGYYVDPSDAALARLLDALSTARTENTRAILNRLGSLGLLSYSWDDVLRRHEGKSWLCSAHVFEAMLEDGLYASWDAWPGFYHRYFGKRSPAYLDLNAFAATEAVETILSAGGVPVLAHPRLIGDDTQIEPLVDHGLLGIEVYYPAHAADDIRRYITLARHYGLIVTGGTDWHGKMTEWDVEIGQCGVGRGHLEALKTAASQVRRKHG